MSNYSLSVYSRQYIPLFLWLPINSVVKLLYLPLQAIIDYCFVQVQRGSIATTHPSTDSLLAEGGDSPADACRSLSCLTDSTDHSAPVNFDMSNRVRCLFYFFTTNHYLLSRKGSAIFREGGAKSNNSQDFPVCRASKNVSFNFILY